MSLTFTYIVYRHLDYGSGSTFFPITEDGACSNVSSDSPATFNASCVEAAACDAIRFLATKGRTVVDGEPLLVRNIGPSSAGGGIGVFAVRVPTAAVERLAIGRQSS